MTPAAATAGPGLILGAKPALPPPRSGSICFCAAERRLLLATRGIGEGVIDRIEGAGVHSLRQLRDLGVDGVVERICDGVGNLAWRNRKRALLRALTAVAATATRAHALSD